MKQLKRPTYLPKIKIVEFAPVGYLTGQQFADRVGTTKQAVNRGLKSGRLANKFLVLAPRNGRATVYIDYNAAVMSYFRALPEMYRPKDFDPKADNYKPLDDKEWKIIATTKAPKRPGPKTIHDGEAFRRTGKKIHNLYPNDMHESKLVHEHKKIEKIEMEILVAKNQLIDITDVQSTIRMMCIEIKQAWEAFKVKTAPLVAAVDDVKSVKEIYLECQKEVADRIVKLRDAYGDGNDAH